METCVLVALTWFFGHNDMDTKRGEAITFSEMLIRVSFERLGDEIETHVNFILTFFDNSVYERARYFSLSLHAKLYLQNAYDKPVFNYRQP